MSVIEQGSPERVIHDEFRCQLSSLSIRELSGLYEAYREASDFFMRFANQPRVSAELPTRILDREADALSHKVEVVVAEITRRVPMTRCEQIDRSKVLISLALDDDDFSAVLQVAADRLKGPDLPFKVSAH